MLKCKNVKFIIICVVLVLMLFTNSFAAIISDNDGSAFVTKAEFDALKNDFNSQIEHYNNSIDSKIDGAIASYLAGIKTSTPPEDTLTKINSSVGGRLWFKNKWPAIGDETLNTEFYLKMTRHYTYNHFYNIIYSAKIDYKGNWFGSALLADWDAAAPTASGRIYYQEYKQSVIEKVYCYDKLGDTWGKTDNKYTPLKSKKDSITNIKEIIDPGVGTGWIVEFKPSGRKIIKQYCNKLYPSYELDVVVHTYGDKAAAKNKTNTDLYIAPNKLGDTQDLGAYDIPALSSWGGINDGTKITTEDTTALARGYSLFQSMTKSSDGIDYSVFMWGKNASTEICYQDENVVPTVLAQDSKPASDTATTFKEMYYYPKAPMIGDNTLSGQKITYYPIEVSNTKGNANTLFCNDYVSTVAGEEVKIGGGIPIVNVTDEDQTNRITLEFECRNSAGTILMPGTDTVHYIVSNKQFNNGALATDAIEYASGTCSTDSSVEFTVENLKGMIWVNIYSATDGNDVSIKSMTIR